MKYRVTPNFLLALGLLLLATLIAVLPHIGGVYSVFSDTETVSVSLGAATGEEFCGKTLDHDGDGEADGDVEHDEDCGECEDGDHDGDGEADGDAEHGEDCGVCEDGDHDGDGEVGDDALLRNALEGGETARPCQWKNGEPQPAASGEPAS